MRYQIVVVLVLNTHSWIKGKYTIVYDVLTAAPDLPCILCRVRQDRADVQIHEHGYRIQCLLRRAVLVVQVCSHSLSVGEDEVGGTRDLAY
jgi:hypothetical protein